MREFSSPRPVAIGSASVLQRRATLASLLATRSGRIGIVLSALVVATALLGPLLTSVDPFTLSGKPLLPPSMAHVFGTDALGRDMLSGLLFGARTSLLVALVSSALTFVCGVAFGLIGGYFGTLIDNLLTRVTELLQVLPRFFLVIVVVALFGPGLDRLVLTLGLTSWPLLARVVRGEVRSLRHTDYVVAAEATGSTSMRILYRTIMPNVWPSAIVVLGLMFGQVLLVEASLGFLGLADPNTMSWGMLAGQAQPFIRVAWWLPLFPGLAITLAVLGVNLLIDAYSTTFHTR